MACSITPLVYYMSHAKVSLFTNRTRKGERKIAKIKVKVKVKAKIKVKVKVKANVKMK